MVAPALATDFTLYCVLACHMTQITLRHGSSDASCYAYQMMGGFVGPVLGDYPRGIRFGQLGRTLMERQKLFRYRAIADLTFAGMISFWGQHVRSAMDLQARAFEEAVEDGIPNGACYSLALRGSALIFAGTPLEDILRETEKGLDFVRRTGFAFPAAHIAAQQRLILSLQGKTDALGSLGGAGFDEGRFEAQLAMGGRTLALPACWYFARKLQARLLAGDYAGALSAAARAKEVLWTSLMFLERVEIVFYESLALAARHDEASAGEKARCREALGRARETARDLGRDVSRELPRPARARVRRDRAHRPRSAAGIGALRAGDPFREGERLRARRGVGLRTSVALLPRACVAPLRGRPPARGTRLLRALGRRRQGARIDRLHPGLLPSAPPAQTGVDAVGAEHLNLLSILRASQTISREIDQEALLRTLLQVVLEQSGARTARLVLVRDDELRLEAEAKIASDGTHDEAVQTRLLGSAPVTLSSPLPASVLDYVRRTRERVLLDDARADAGRFAGDEYLARAKTRSLLCQPVLRQDQVIALLVLENDLVPGVFARGRLGALELLATQAAISIENARLLKEAKEAQDSIRARDVFLSLASHELRTPVTSLMLTTQRFRGDKLESASESIRSAVILFDRQVGRLKTLIDDMMSVGQILLGRLSAEPVPVDLAALVRDEVQRSSASFEAPSAR